MSNETPTPTAEPTPKPPVNKLRWIGIGLLALLVFNEGFGFYRGVVNRVVEMEAEISEQSKKEALYELSAIQNKLKTQGAITTAFSDREERNVKTNMDAKRTIALGVMSVLSSDLRSVSAPTNGLMELKHSNEFYKTLMDNAGQEYGHLKDIMKARSVKITAYEKFIKDPLYAPVLRFAGYPSLNLKEEKSWSILTTMTRKANETGVADPINAVGKNKDIEE